MNPAPPMPAPTSSHAGNARVSLPLNPKAEIMIEVTRHLIDGEWRGSGDIAIENPSDIDTPFGTSASGTVADLDEAIAAARAAFPGWSMASPQVRSDILDKAGSLVIERSHALGRILASEEGKTLAEGIGESVRAGQILKFFAGEALRLTGERVASTRPGVDVEITREPLGVIGLITPWNFPIAIPTWKLAPAIAFGNTVVLKPAELTPATAAALVAILVEAGLPPGVVNLVLGKGRLIGQGLVDSGDVDAISFTGSVPTGRSIAAACAARGKAVQCEMGGKNPMVVLADADMAVAVAASLNGAFFSTGQRCTASSRLIVERRVHDEFVEKLTAAMAKLVVGPALDAATQIGPVVDAAQFGKDRDYITGARAQGAEVFGGETQDCVTRGYFLRPALAIATRPDMTINREEIFGPVASTIIADDYDHALAIANDTEFGLSAGICTTSLARSRHFLRHAQAGMVMVNLPTAGVDPHVPFGGRKASSFGSREQGSYARHFYTALKTGYIG
jgi:alpha-ketoglutaric semialdehyde dehydrogenase